MSGAALGVIAVLLAASAIDAGVAQAVAKKTAVRKAVVGKSAIRKKASAGRRSAKRTLSTVVAPPAPPPVAYQPLPDGGDRFEERGAVPRDVALYRYIDDAAALIDTVGRAPPDYAFRCDGSDCFGWTLQGGNVVLAEPVGDRFRFYAFAPGDDFPFFVGDEQYSYGFDGPYLSAVYGPEADLVAWQRGGPIADGAAWLSRRGQTLKRAAARRTIVPADDWADARYGFATIELRFGSWRSRRGWEAYRYGPGERRSREWRASLSDEAARRRESGDRFDRRHGDRFRTGSPPGGWPAPGEHRDGRPAWPGAPGTPDRARDERPDRWRGDRTDMRPGRPVSDTPNSNDGRARGEPGASDRVAPPTPIPGDPAESAGRDSHGRHGGNPGHAGGSSATTPSPEQPADTSAAANPPSADTTAGRSGRGGAPGHAGRGAESPPTTVNRPTMPPIGVSPAESETSAGVEPAAPRDRAPADSAPPRRRPIVRVMPEPDSGTAEPPAAGPSAPIPPRTEPAPLPAPVYIVPVAPPPGAAVPLPAASPAAEEPPRPAPPPPPPAPPPPPPAPSSGEPIDTTPRAKNGE